MDKYNGFLLLVVLNLFVYQSFAASFQSCSEAGREDAPVESQTDVNRMTTDCHKTEDGKTSVPEICDAQHCCIGATFSVVYATGHSLTDMDKDHINYPGPIRIYPSLDDIFHPPKFLL